MGKISGLGMLILLGMFSIKTFGGEEGIRYLDYEGSSVKTTYIVDHKFIGKYKGSKQGYLLLNADGTGQYRYDYFGFAADNCKDGPIEMEWGFLLDENNQIVKFKRDYGFSYPVIYYSTSQNFFKGCTKIAMLDYILEYNDGTITVSSSDDWVRINNN